MRMTFAPYVSVAILLQISAPSPAQEIPASNAAIAEKGDPLAALERKLLGTWLGPACGGDYTYHADGTFSVAYFTPGQNNLTGTWSIRWDAIPPTLLLTYKTSDIRTQDPDRIEFEYLGKTREAKVHELNGESLVYRFPGDEWIWHFTRREGEEWKRHDGLLKVSSKNEKPANPNDGLCA